MKPILQTKFRKEGNCLAACVASILEIDINDVPDLPDEPDHEWFLVINGFLQKIGYYYITIEITDDRVPVVGYHVIQGITKRGTFHAVVGKDKKIVHDPMGSDQRLKSTSFGLIIKII